MILEGFRPDGRAALVTCGNRGLGQICAIALAEAGADLALLGRTEPAETAAHVKGLGKRAVYVPCDLAEADPAQLAAAVTEAAVAETTVIETAVIDTTGQLGRLEILVNNTGIIRRAPAARCASILDRIPAGRWGRPQDLMDAVVFLALEAARNVHGAVLPVDGGWLAR